MFCVYLAFALSLPVHSRLPQTESSWFTCDSSKHGDSVCKSKGMALYVSYGLLSAPEPSVLYPLSYASRTLDEDFVNNKLSVNSAKQSLVSGKFTGVFVPSETGLHVFTIKFSHTVISDTCYFNVYAHPASIELSLSYGVGNETGYGQSCSADSSPCSDTDYTNSETCTRSYYLVAGNRYPIFGGLLYNVGVSYSSNLTLDFTYQRPSGLTQWIRDVDAVVSMSADISGLGSSSVSGSGNGMSNKVIIAGACIGVFVLLGIVGVVLFLLSKYEVISFRVNTVGRRKSSDRGSGIGVIPRKLSGSGSGFNNRRLSGSSSRRMSSSSSRRKIGLGIRRKSGPSSRKRSGSGSRKGSGSGSRKRSGSGSRRRSGSGSRKRSGSGSRKRSGSGSRKRSGSGSRRRSGSGSRKRSGSGSHKRSGSGSRKRSGSGSRRRSGSGSRRRSGSGSRRRSGSGSRRRSGSGSRKRSGSGSRRRSGSGSRRRSGSGSRKRSGSGSHKRTGPNNRMMTGPSNRMVTGPSNRVMTGPSNRMMNGGGVRRKVSGSGSRRLSGGSKSTAFTLTPPS